MAEKTGTKTEAEADFMLSKAKEIHKVDGEPLIAVPGDFRIINLNHFTDTPRFISTDSAHSTLTSFMDYCARFKQPGTQIVFDYEASTITANLDYHTPGKPGHCAHNAVYHVKRSLVFNIWAEQSGKWMNQTEMIEFIEDNAHQVVLPKAEEILELVSNFRLVRTSTFNKVVDISASTVQLVYAEEDKGGSIEFPKELTLSAPIYKGQDAIELKARFRYKLSNTKELTLSFKIQQIERLEEENWLTIIAAIKDSLPGGHYVER